MFIDFGVECIRIVLYYTHAFRRFKPFHSSVEHALCATLGYYNFLHIRDYVTELRIGVVKKTYTA